MRRGDPCPLCGGRKVAFDPSTGQWGPAVCRSCGGSGTWDHDEPASGVHNGSMRYEAAEYPGQQRRHRWQTAEIDACCRSRSYPDYVRRSERAGLFVHSQCAWSQRRGLSRRLGMRVRQGTKGPRAAE